VPLPDDTVRLIRERGLAFLSTLMPDGSPQLTEVWVDTDGEDVLVNTVEGHQKLRNIRRDPRVAILVADPAEPRRYVQLRGEVVEETTDGADAHIDAVSQRYLGRPYQQYGEGPQTRVLLRIRVRPPRSRR
jgi:PPOX class probable F420-dependent enzyme